MRGKCWFCGRQAYVYLKYANIRLCKEHFIEYFRRRVERTISRFKMIKKGDLIAVGVSGGKDSIALLEVLNNLKDKLGFEILAIHLNLGIGEYSKISEEVVKRVSNLLGIKFKIVSIKNLAGFNISDVKKLGFKLCSVCGLVKRYWLNRIAFENGATKLATAHTLDDMAMFILQNFLNGDYVQLSRLSPVLPPGLKMVSKIKPFALTPETDIIEYVNALKLPYVKINCPFKAEAKTLEVRKALEVFGERYNAVLLNMVSSFFKKLQPLLYENFSRDIEIRACNVCSYPSTGKICSYCKLREKILTRLNLRFSKLVPEQPHPQSNNIRQ